MNPYAANIPPRLTNYSSARDGTIDKGAPQAIMLRQHAFDGHGGNLQAECVDEIPTRTSLRQERNLPSASLPALPAELLAALAQEPVKQFHKSKIELLPAL